MVRPVKPQLPALAPMKSWSWADARLPAPTAAAIAAGSKRTRTRLPPSFRTSAC